jgi:hypothetical protein
MKLVKENLNEFKQGGDPYNKLGVGKYDNNYDFDNPQDGDEIELLEDIYNTSYMQNDVLEYNGEKLTTYKQIQDSLYLEYDEGDIFIYDEDSEDWRSPYENLISRYWIIKNKNIFKKIR